MTTVRDCIEQAYRRIRIVGIGDTMPADLADHGLGVFNSMLLGSDFLGWNGSAAAPYALTDDYPLDLATYEAACYVLGARLAPDFGVQIGFDEQRWLRVLQASTFQMDDLAMPNFRNIKAGLL